MVTAVEIFCTRPAQDHEPITVAIRLIKVLILEPNILEPNIGLNRLMRYNWRQPDWPHFRYNLDAVSEDLVALAEHSGRMDGLLEACRTDWKSKRSST